MPAACQNASAPFMCGVWVCVVATGAVVRGAIKTKKSGVPSISIRAGQTAKRRDCNMYSKGDQNDRQGECRVAEPCDH